MALLDEAAPEATEQTAYRLAALPEDSTQFLREMGLDADELTEALAFLDAAEEPSQLSDALDKPFQRKHLLPGSASRTRFSDGSFPVLYGALDRETCAAEVAYHCERRGSHPAHFQEISYAFSGRAVDLRPFHTAYPDLTNPDDYTFCNGLGSQAVARSMDGFLTPSARSHPGTCLPAFRREAVSQPERVGLRRIP